MSEILAPAEFIAVLDDTFERGQQFTFIPSGNSMKPMLNGVSDKVTFSPKPEKLSKYDVALYLRPDTGQLVLHRMVGFDKDGGYVFSGDGQYTLEYGITDADVLALLTEYTHNGRRHTVDEPGYKRYVRTMMGKKRLRMFAGRMYHRIIK